MKRYITFIWLTIFSSCFSQTGWFELKVPVIANGVDMHFINSTTGFIITYNSDFLVTTNGGLNWTVRTVPQFSNFGSVYFFNAQTGFLTLGNFIYKTTNAGIDWILKYSTPKYLKKIRFANPQTGYACGTDKLVLKTQNGGENWETVKQTTTHDDLYNMFVFDYNTVFVCGFNFFQYPVFSRTIDGGFSWVGTAPGGNLQVYYQTTFINSDTGYLLGSGDGGSLLKTTNGGTSWNRINTNPPETYFLSCYFFNVNTGYLGTSYGRIFKTTNGGVTLSLQHEDTNTGEIYQISFLGNDTAYAIAHDKYLKTINGGEPVGVFHNSTSIPDKFSLSQNYPNPFNPLTRINYELPITNYIILKVYDALGNEVETLVNEKQSAGSYSVDFNAASLPSGIYFYKLITEKFSETKKMILVK
jgi:photosystem II stability/assembly factor-like uncharacterized protein